jgi:hypothetical protein
MGRRDGQSREKPPIWGCSESQFVEQLTEEIRKGISLVPFIGSGLSAPSGILMGKEFAQYLTTTVFLCIEEKRDLHLEGWPKFPSDKEVGNATAWVTLSKRKLSNLDRKGEPLTAEDNILREALHSLKDWRSTLEFLARLYFREQKLSLEDVDQSIIDNFNFHITRGRRPNFGHSMLCHLVGPAHIRTVLTTNFDTLIEDAFAKLNLKFEVISVGLKDALPSPDMVHSLNCIIKLHGSIKDTRADQSLNSIPTLDDKKRFCSYVRGGDQFRDGARFRPGHLLVIGYSGTELRCVRMIKFLLSQDPEAKVYWVCFKKADQETLQKIFHDKVYQHALQRPRRKSFGDGAATSG